MKAHRMMFLVALVIFGALGLSLIFDHTNYNPPHPKEPIAMLSVVIMLIATFRMALKNLKRQTCPLWVSVPGLLSFCTFFVHTSASDSAGSYRYINPAAEVADNLLSLLFLGLMILWFATNIDERINGK